MRTFKDGDEAEVLVLARRFADVYRAHILVEDKELFPRAAKELSAEAIAEMGAEMEGRRPDRQEGGRRK